MSLHATYAELEQAHNGLIPATARAAALRREDAERRRCEALSEARQLQELIASQARTTESNRRSFIHFLFIYRMRHADFTEGRCTAYALHMAKADANLFRRHWISSRMLQRRFEAQLAAIETTEIRSAAE
jgi:hypothetical protein